MGWRRTKTIQKKIREERRRDKHLTAHINCESISSCLHGASAVVSRIRQSTAAFGIYWCYFNSWEKSGVC